MKLADAHCHFSRPVSSDAARDVAVEGDAAVALPARPAGIRRRR
jgi:hypothetical protein